MNKEKINLILGLAIGVAVISLVGFIILAVAYWHKDQDDLAGTGEEIAEVAAGNSKLAIPKEPSAAPKKVTVSEGDHIRGNIDAPITIVEYSDFQCPFCTRFHNTMNQVLANYPNDVRWVYKHFPLDSIHPYAKKAAEASECANDQGKFWEYNDKMYANQRSINTAYLSTAAKELGFDKEVFDECLSSGKYASKVNDDIQEGKSVGARGTPGSFLNGEALGGAVPYEQLKVKIESLR